MKNLQSILLLSFFLLAVNFMRAQGNSCATLEPFCAGSEELVFENSNPFNGGLAQAEVGHIMVVLKRSPIPPGFFCKSKKAEISPLQFHNSRTGMVAERSWMLISLSGALLTARILIVNSW